MTSWWAEACGPGARIWPTILTSRLGKLPQGHGCCLGIINESPDVEFVGECFMILNNQIINLGIEWAYIANIHQPQYGRTEIYID